MSTLRVSLFSKLSVRLGDRALENLHSAKAEELFCFLLLRRNLSHPRETLAGMLWGDCPTFQSKKYLRQALWQLQFALNSSLVPAARRVLLVAPDWVRLNEQADLWLDVAAFERACVLAQGAPAQTLDARVVQALEAAVALYRGDLLEGWYQDWCLYERERLQNMFLALLDKLMAICEVREDFEAGLAYGVRILRYDPAHERTHQRMIRLKYLAGDRVGALRQYECCRAQLKEELGVRPSKLTRALYQQIRADRLETSPATPARTPAATDQAPLLLPKLLSHLKQLRSCLADVQREVQRDVSTVEQALKLECRRSATAKRSSATHLPTPGLSGSPAK